MRNFIKSLCCLALVFVITGSVSNLNAQIITTIAGNGSPVWAADGVPATATSLNPCGIFVDASYNIFFADYANNRVRKIDPSGIVTTIAGTGTGTYSGDGGPATAANLYNPAGVTGDNMGNIYIADYRNHAIRKINSSGIITTICGNGSSGFAGDGGMATASGVRISYPVGILLGPSGNLIFTDANNHRVREINSSGIINTIVGSGLPIAPAFGGDGGPATNARLADPYSISMDASGKLYVADQSNHRIRVVNTSGIITTLAGTTVGFSGDGGSPVTAQLHNPTDISVDPAGNNIYITDRFNHCVRKISSGIINTISGAGTISGFSGDGGLATAAKMNEPCNLFVAASGDVYISDFKNNRIRKLSSGNRAPYFTRKKPNLRICLGGGAIGIDTLLTVNDSDVSQTLTWVLHTPPLHGTASTADTVTSTGGNVSPSGTTYTPFPGYRGLDSFKVKVDDGVSVDITTIYVTIDSLPIVGVIKGPTSVCEGASITLSNDTLGGIWTASNGNLTIGSTTGFVTGVTAGYDTISYTVTNTCGSSTVTRIDTVNQVPAAISGTRTVCPGSSTILTSSPTGGVWTSGNSAVATVATGTVTGITNGTSTITYSLNRCPVMVTVTVYPIPAPIQPSTPVTVCVGRTVTLSDITPSGVWSSGNTGVATITTGGLVAGVIAGTSTISYTNGFGCSATKVVTVNAVPAAITPSAATVCAGHGTIFSDATGGGTWSSSNSGIASVGTGSGTVTGVTAGTATISYTVGGCSATATVSVNPSPAAITPAGTSSICVGNTVALTSATSGGTWASGNSGIATVTSGGLVTGVSTGGTLISYTNSFSCVVTKSVTVVSGVSAISPSSPVACTGSTVSLTNATTGGVWTSSNSSVASVGTGGVATGVTSGTATISYTLGGCSATVTLSVNPSPSAITPAGASSICVGNTVALSSATSGGTWTSGNSGVATVSTGGLVTAVSTGSTLISYANSFGCIVTKSVTVISGVSAITPSSPSTCAGSTVTLTNATTGGVWSSGNSAVASVGTSGIVTGVTAGTATITYSASGCFVAVTVTVNPLPVAIVGASSICQNTSGTFSNATTGGSWTSSNSSVVSIDGFTGGYTASSSGTATITYTTSGGCSSVKSVTVNPQVSLGSGWQVCQGSTVALTGVSGSTWSSTNTAVATVNSTGVVTGVTPGTAQVSYLSAFGCTSVTTVSVNALPAAITPAGAAIVCVGNVTALSSTTSGGVWSSSATSVATVSSGGVVTGVGTGTALISYTNLSGCFDTAVVNVASGLATISPATASVCPGLTTTLSNSAGGGLWTSSNTSIATVSSGGIVTGVITGTATISYGLGSCYSTANVSVLTAPAAITGYTSICQGFSDNFSDATPGGTWTSSNTSVISIFPATGAYFAAGAGSATVTYTVVGGCQATHSITVNPLIALAPGYSACAASSISLIGVPGATWSSSNTSVATVNSSGLVTTLAAGTSNVFYTTPSGCGAVTSVTVNPAPAAITPSGSVTICRGTTAALSSTTTGGTWSSSATSVATVGSTGIVTGVFTGSATISYTSVTGCAAVKIVTVAPAPLPITPSSTTVCPAVTVTLSDAVTGGSWTSGNTTLATVGSASGIVTGVAQGSLTITYAIGSCQVIATVTVNPAPNAGSISGPSTVCVGSSISLTNATPGGGWSSSNTAVATVNSSGLVSSISGGTVTISYSVTNICGTARALATVTVNTAPTAGTITGPASICAGTAISYSNATSGGVYSGGSVHASVSSTGLITGISVGTTTITYTVTTPCGTAATSRTVAIGAFLTAGTITGATSLCQGSIVTLSNPATGGVWSSSATGVATVGTSGVVTGTGGGTAIISYTATASCGSAFATHTLTVNPAPAPGSITGTSLLCAGTVTTYTNTATGGIWTVMNPSASITGTGLLTGITPGTNTISYSVTNSCGTAVVTKTVTIGAYLNAGTITGPSSVCAGSSISLSDAIAGGVWSTTNANVTIGSASGLVTGVSSGLDTIFYTVTASCGSAAASYVVTVNPLPVAGTISGPSAVCIGSTITLSNFSGGGVWSMTNSRATITSVGVVTPVATGDDTAVYTVTNVCGTAVATQVINIGFLLTAGTISGPSVVCQGAAITLTDAAPFGVWSSSNTAVATVGSTGVVSGTGGGTATILYTVANVCGTVVATTTVTVNPLADPGVISGPANLCLGTPATYSDPISGGTWSVSNTNATISSGGVVTPVSVGLVTISYSVVNGCGTNSATNTVAIGTVPGVGAISGPSGICLGSSATLTDAAPGGIWTSTNTSVASIGSTGLTTGLALGTSVISYSVVNGCGIATASMVVTIGMPPVAGVITGPAGICAGSFTIYTNSIPGGVWSTSNTAAGITSAGVLSAYTPFTTDTVMYTVTNGCGTAVASKVVTIGAYFSAGTITGPSNVCVGSAVTLSSSVSGGIWTRSNSNAAIGSLSGIVTGITPGIDTIYYSVTSGCGTANAMAVITISSFPSAGVISGPSVVCTGSSVTLTDAVPGGVWSASNSNATISAGGILTGVTAGTDTIYYAVAGLCGTATAAKIVTVSSLPGAGTITGPASICAGGSATLSNAVSGGIWTSANTAVIIVGTGGIVTGVAGGTGIISYSVVNICGVVSATTTITVNTAPSLGAIAGPDSVCLGDVITLTNTVPGGVWTAGNSNATVVAGTGVVTGVTNGTTPINYTVSNSCGTAGVVKVISIGTIPFVGAITGPTSVCVGSGITLSNPVAGGIWLASNTNANIVSPGIIYGVTVGIDTIFYAKSNACGTAVASRILPVNPIPFVAPISGPTRQCAGSVSTWSNTVTGGVWISSDPVVAMVGISSGTVSGVTPGTSTITYTVTNSFGCPASVTQIDTVLPVPGISAITGSTAVCAGASVSLAHPDAGGVWSSSNTAVAAVDASGSVTGVAPGTAIISYAVANICGTGTAIRTETVNALPVLAAITGGTSICEGASVTLFNSTGGGSWSSDNTAIAVAGTSGIVTGIAAGTVTISYTYTNASGCTASVTRIETIDAAPLVAPISGITHECPGATTTLASATTGGVWTSSNTLIATVGASSGIVTGVAPGTSFIMYTVTNGTGCTTSVSVEDTVVGPPAVASITGASSVCIGASVSLSDVTTGGTWSATNANATVSAGLVTGVTAGIDTIVYTVTGACGTASVTHTININGAPVPGAILGATSLCTGSTITLTNAITGGSWSTAATAITITPATGVVNGIVAGTATVTYTVTDACGTGSVTSVITVNAIPVAGTITGASSVCVGSSITLTNTVSGGLWTASNPRATVVGGVVTGVTAGIDTITYRVSNACGTAAATKTVAVIAVPSAGVITGPASVCMGSTITLGNAAVGGIWSSSNPSIATISAGGVVTPLAPGIANIVYSLSGSCGTGSTTRPISVISLADCNHGSTTGVSTVAAIVDLKIYPNPNNGLFTMNLLSDNNEQVQVTITNVVGQKVKEFVATTNSTVEIKLDQPVGIYVLSAVVGNIHYMAKVVVE